MGRKKQHRKNVGWFSPTRRKFIAAVLKYGALLTTIVANLKMIVGERPSVPVAPVRITASDTISVNESVVVTPGTATASFGTTGPVVVIS